MEEVVIGATSAADPLSCIVERRISNEAKTIPKQIHFDAAYAGRLRTAAQGAYPRQPECRQRQTDAAHRHHAAAALCGLSAVAQRDCLPE